MGGIIVGSNRAESLPLDTVIHPHEIVSAEGGTIGINKRYW